MRATAMRVLKVVVVAEGEGRKAAAARVVEVGVASVVAGEAVARSMEAVVRAAVAKARAEVVVMGLVAAAAAMALGAMPIGSADHNQCSQCRGRMCPCTRCRVRHHRTFRRLSKTHTCRSRGCAWTPAQRQVVVVLAAHLIRLGEQPSVAD